MQKDPRTFRKHNSYFKNTKYKKFYKLEKKCICCMARRRVGIPGNRDVRSNQECWWSFLYRTSTATWFVDDITRGGNPTAPHQGTNERRGRGGHVVCMLMGFMNSRGQEVTCVYEP